MELKYHNHAQLVQGVCQVDDDSLTPTERLFLNCLAAYSVKTYPHPGNDRLRRACGVSSRQGVNKIAKRLADKKLIEKLDHSKGGRGMAVVYRIITEDPRFPDPKGATVELPLSDKQPATPELPLSKRKPATGDMETRNSAHLNPQLEAPKPATLELHPDSNSGYKNGYNPDSAAVAADVEDDFHEPTDEEHVQRYCELKTKLAGDDTALARLDAYYRTILERVQPTPEPTPTAIAPGNEKSERFQLRCSRCLKLIPVSEYATHPCEAVSKTKQ